MGHGSDLDEGDDGASFDARSLTEGGRYTPPTVRRDARLVERKKGLVCR